MALASFPCPIHELHIEHTVVCGQTFRWRQDKDGWWACLLPVRDGGKSGPRQQLVRLWQDRETVYYETQPRTNGLALIRDYFRLDLNLPALTRDFAEADPFINHALQTYPGLRVLRQDPEECLFSFLCTPAAPLHRIRSAITALCHAFGDPFPQTVAGVRHYAFPPAERLAEASVEQMMRYGLGFRARHIKDSARLVMQNGGAEWLLGLRERSYADAKAALMTLPGVGDKIADCICLFSLDKDDAVPVDTHIRQVALRRYVSHEGPYLPIASTSTRKGYAAIGDLLRSRFGAYAGWAQQYLFFDDLFEKGSWNSYALQLRYAPSPVRPLK